MSGQQIPPWLRDQLVQFRQSQDNLQSIMAQKQNLEMERLNVTKAIEELGKAQDDDTVYKQAGSILIRSTKQALTEDLEEKHILAKTRLDVLVKQESKLKEILKEQEAKINEAVRGPGAAGHSPPN